MDGQGENEYARRTQKESYVKMINGRLQQIAYS